MQPTAPPGSPCHADPDLLLRLARAVATRVVKNPILAEEAGERAVHKFLVLSLSGREPRAPEAWVRVAARRFAQSLRRRRRLKYVALDLDQLLQPDLDSGPHHAVDLLVQQVQPLLTVRQTEAVKAAMSSRSMRDAARSCRMSPRDLRRSLGLVGEKCRASIADAPAGLGRAMRPVA